MYFLIPQLLLILCCILVSAVSLIVGLLHQNAGRDTIKNCTSMGFYALILINVLEALMYVVQLAAITVVHLVKVLEYEKVKYDAANLYIVFLIGMFFLWILLLVWPCMWLLSILVLKVSAGTRDDADFENEPIRTSSTSLSHTFSNDSDPDN